jgi:hypothetical protein
VSDAFTHLASYVGTLAIAEGMDLYRWLSSPPSWGGPPVIAWFFFFWVFESTLKRIISEAIVAALDKREKRQTS